MVISLEIPDDRQKLADLIKSDIDAWCADKYNEITPRKHLGASVMGKPCDRQIWYGFRWVRLEVHEGRVQRIFQVGHNAEPRFIEYLRGIGFEVRPFQKQLWYSETLNEYATKEWDADLSGGVGSFILVYSAFHLLKAKEHGIDIDQWRITGCDDHYGGSLDGKCKAPARYEVTEDLVFLNEFKTNGTGAGYAKVASSKLSESKPDHWKQMCQYGYKMGLKYGLYLIENKNDSDITVKIVELDWNVGRECEKRAQDIISARVPPPRISENPAWRDCSFCTTFRGICHYNEKVEINCRSCRNASPIADGKWNCDLYGEIPDSFIPAGCPQHVSVNGG